MFTLSHHLLLLHLVISSATCQRRANYSLCILSQGLTRSPAVAWVGPTVLVVTDLGSLTLKVIQGR